MESRIVRSLTAADFFVEPNVAHRDPRTSKSREIDLTAEDATAGYSAGCAVKTTFIIEAINNRYPVVLLTERQSTPNADFESYVKFSGTPDPWPFLDAVDVYEERATDWRNLFSQYCALSKKSGKDELMASHPDDIYTSLLKLAEFTESQLSEFNEWAVGSLGEYWRLFFWQPMLVVSGQLMTVKHASNGELQFEETALARLEFNWHDGEVRKTTAIEVLREDFLISRLDTIRAQDKAMANRIRAYREANHLDDER